MPKHFYLHLKMELKNHLFDYLLLFTAGIFFLILLINETLHLKTVVEYILIAFIIIFLLKIIILP